LSLKYFSVRLSESFREHFYGYLKSDFITSAFFSFTRKDASRWLFA